MVVGAIVGTAGAGATPAGTSSVRGHGVTPAAWSIVPSPDVVGSSGQQLLAVSCTSSTFCMAVGSSFGTVQQTLVEQWNGSTWTIVPSPDTSAAYNNQLLGVSCVTSSFCMAAGFHTQSGSLFQSLLEEWNGSTWSIVSSPDSPAAGGDVMDAVSCAGPTVCMAAGDNLAGAAPAALVWNGTAWSVTTPVVPAGFTSLPFNGVACRSAQLCMAVGSASGGSPAQPLVEQWNGSNWSLGSAPAPTGGTSDVLRGVSCPSPSLCVAAGSITLAGQPTALVDQWNGSSWSYVPSPAGPGPIGDIMEAVSCAGPTSCTAVGYVYNSIGSWVTESMVWNGTTWTLLPPANPTPPTTGTDQAFLYGVSCLGGGACVAVGSAPTFGTSGAQTLAESAPVSRPGYRLVAADGGIFTFGGAGFDGSAGSLHLNQPIVGMAPTPDGGGYWLVAKDGGVFTYGDAGFYGSAAATPLVAPVVGMAATADGAGYWLVGSNGAVYPFGDAGSFGSMAGIPLNAPVVGMASDRTGQGYWLVARDGGVFAFGNASFRGSAGAIHLNQPIVGMAGNPTGSGYWLVAADGGVFSYGAASFFGSHGGSPLNQPIVSMAPSPDGQGYWLAAADGGIFTYGDATFSGSTGSIRLNQPVVGMGA
jgi:hypothetical protein